MCKGNINWLCLKLKSCWKGLTSEWWTKFVDIEFHSFLIFHKYLYKWYLNEEKWWLHTQQKKYLVWCETNIQRQTVFVQRKLDRALKYDILPLKCHFSTSLMSICKTDFTKLFGGYWIVGEFPLFFRQFGKALENNVNIFKFFHKWFSFPMS